jgi:two-component system, OmpR family, phosphate regulon response regulator PhoB
MKPRVLLVDDSVLILRIATAFLRERYDVISATSSDEAVRKATEARPDLIVMDFNMPDRTGVETARLLRHSSQTRRIPVVIMTTESEAHRIPRDLDHLCKPFDAEGLLASVAAHLPRAVASPAWLGAPAFAVSDLSRGLPAVA